MNIRKFFNNKRNIATLLILMVIFTIYVATSQSKYVLEKELNFNLEIIESEEWNKRTLITGEELNEVLLSSGATSVIFGYKNDYLTEIENIEGTAVAIADTTKSFTADDIKLYIVTDSENIITAYILSEYQIKANVNSSKMFYNYEALTEVYLSNFDTSIVENMDSMFYSCKNLIILDLYKFDTAKLTNISSIFYDCNLLETIYVSELWNLSGITTVQENVFYNCVNLVGKNNTVYNNTKISSDYACIDTEETPGYFTYKSINTVEPLTFNLNRTVPTNIYTLNITTNNEITNTDNPTNTLTNNTTTSSTGEKSIKNDDGANTTNNLTVNEITTNNSTEDSNNNINNITNENIEFTNTIIE